MKTNTPFTTDICILGAGPGGAATALHLANKGISCTLIDKAVFPRDKVCGDALSGKVVSELKRINPGLLDKLDQSQIQLPSWGISFTAPNLNVLKVPFKWRYDTAKDKNPGYIARRTDFDNLLVEEVKAQPLINFIQGTEISNFKREDGKFLLYNKKDQLIGSAKLIIAANGAQSSFSRHVAGIEQKPDHYCAGLRAYYSNVTGLDKDNFIELHFFKDFLPGYFWIFPLPGGYANVGVGMLSKSVSQKKVNLKKQMLQIIAEHPQLKQRFANAEIEGDIKGYGLPLGSVKRNISGDNFMLVGDAASLIDPFSGEGISNAMISGRWAAEQAAKCLEADNYSADFMKTYDKNVYNRLWKELKLSRRMQQLLNYPWLFNIIANRAASNPTLAETISCMFLDLDLREKLKKPSFYLKLLFK